jgi:hypothetical protein
VRFNVKKLKKPLDKPHQMFQISTFLYPYNSCWDLVNKPNTTKIDVESRLKI